MLLLPYRDSSMLRTAPVVTALIVLACALVLFGVQSQDPGREREAVEFYRGSGLGQIEQPRYQAYLADRNDPDAAARLHLLERAAPGSVDALRILQSDGRFLADLHAGRVVPPSDPAYVAWSADRRRFDQLAGAVAQAQYSLSRAQIDQPWRFVTYAFLHNGLAHFLGNMLVLVLVGPFVEAAMGQARFALAYLAGAAAAGLLHVAVSDAPVIGASGAIAAAVGMLAVSYGTRRVPVFYWFIIFGTARVPALALLPVWLVNEGYQWTLQSHAAPGGGAVAYGAHIGGLCAGALLAWMLTPPAPVEARGRAGGPGTLGGAGAAGTADRRPTGSMLVLSLIHI